MLCMMAAENLKNIFVGLDDASPDQIRKIDIFISFFWRAKRAKKFLKTHFFLFENLRNLSKNSLKSAKKVTIYFCQMVMHFK